MNRSVQQISKFIVTSSFLLGKEVDQQFSMAVGYQKTDVTTVYMHCLAYHIPDQIRRYGYLRMFSGQGILKM